MDLDWIWILSLTSPTEGLPGPWVFWLALGQFGNVPFVGFSQRLELRKQVSRLEDHLVSILSSGLMYLFVYLEDGLECRVMSRFLGL